MSHGKARTLAELDSVIGFVRNQVLCPRCPHEHHHPHQHRGSGPLARKLTPVCARKGCQKYISQRNADDRGAVKTRSQCQGQGSDGSRHITSTSNLDYTGVRTRHTKKKTQHERLKQILTQKMTLRRSLDKRRSIYHQANSASPTNAQCCHWFVFHSSASASLVRT